MKVMKAEDVRFNDTSNEKKEFDRWVIVFFAIFFLIALVTRVLPTSMRPLASSDRESVSVYKEAMQAAHDVVPFIFALH